MEATHQEAVVGGTHKEQARAWNRWEQYTTSIGLFDDIFLDSFSHGQRINLIGTFSKALCQGQFLASRYDALAESTVQSTVLYVAQNFRDFNRSNPTKDKVGELGRLLSRLYRAFCNIKPNPVQ